MPVETAHAQAVRERAVETWGSEADGRGSDANSRDSAVGPTTRDGAVWVGVVRSPPGWFRRRVDLTRPALGLPAEAHEELERRRRDLQMQGLCAEGAHNAAWEELRLDERYRTSLMDEETEEALEEVRTLAERERVVVATDRPLGFRCHRSVLASVLESARAGQREDGD